MIDEGTQSGARAARRLREDVVIWLTTVTPAASPLPAPVWFVWDGADSVQMYSQPGSRIRNLEANPHVSLNFDGDRRGGDIVVLAGEASIVRDAPPADQATDYVEKYRDQIARIGMTPETFAQRYSVPVRIRLTRLRGR